jgi:hypothetical protein
MPVLTSPAVAERPPWDNVTPIQGTPVVATSNLTNTATSATLITGMSITFTLNSKTSSILMIFNGDSVSNSGANNVVITAWLGVVGTGTQVGQTTFGAQSGAVASCQGSFAVSPSLLSLTPGTSYTLRLAMHGTGAGTNTITAGTTNPFVFSLLMF